MIGFLRKMTKHQSLLQTSGCSLWSAWRRAESFLLLYHFLILIEMNRLLLSIPLVAEEDSSFLQSTNLVGAVVDAVANKATFRDELTENSILKAIDRGGKDACNFGPNPATYWVLDPIDGTTRFC